MERFKTFISQLDEAKAGETCNCCDNKIDENGKCGCGPDCEHCGGQHDMSEAAPKISKGKAKGSISATGLRGKGMKKFDVSVKIVNGKFEFRITDEQGKFQTVGLKQAARMLGESVVDDLVNEARGTSAKHAGKSGMFGGKYTSKDHMLGMKNFNKVRDKRAADKNAQHKEQDPKMAKMGYAKHMLDTDKADAKARKRGIDPSGKYDKYKKRNGIREELDEDTINNLTAQYINENDITLDQLENMTEEELNELIGKAIGGAFKVGAKAAVGAARLAKKGANRMSASGRADAAEKKADSIEKRNKDRARIKAAQDRVRTAKAAARENK